MEADTIDMQTLQDEAGLEVIVEGLANWNEFLEQEINYTEEWTERLKMSRGTVREMLDLMAWASRVPKEQAYLSALINAGYKLVEAEVMFTNFGQKSWGRCTWIPNHESYGDPEHVWRVHFDENATDYAVSLIDSRFVTEHMGEQSFTLTSTSVGKTFLFQRSTIFHWMVFARST